MERLSGAKALTGAQNPRHLLRPTQVGASSPAVGTARKAAVMSAAAAATAIRRVLTVKARGIGVDTG